MRQIVLDTETTGLEPAQGHRIIEIGCVELDNRRLTGNDLHLYLHPERDIDQAAVDVHGITLEFLADKPRFADTAQALGDYLAGAELIIHNAPFDLAFLDSEYSRLDTDHVPLEQQLTIIDTLVDARQKYPGQRNSLDALCKRFGIDNTNRELHGALLDAQLLADVYRAMTGGQIDIGLLGEESAGHEASQTGSGLAARMADGQRPRVQRASDAEIARHEQYLDMLADKSGGHCLWRGLDNA